MKKNTIYIVIAAILGAVVAGGAIFGVMREKKDKTDVVVAINDIKEIAQLATVEYHISTFLDRSIRTTWYEWKNARLLVLLKGIVKGSVDLNQADIQLATAPSKHATITFRKGAILVSNPEIGPDDIKVITVSNPNLIHPIKDADRNAAKRDAITELRKTAMDAGIVTKTAEEARILLTRFLGGLGYTTTIVFEDVQVEEP